MHIIDNSHRVNRIKSSLLFKAMAQRVQDGDIIKFRVTFGQQGNEVDMFVNATLVSRVMYGFDDEIIPIVSNGGEERIVEQVVFEYPGGQQQQQPQQQQQMPFHGGQQQQQHQYPTHHPPQPTPDQMEVRERDPTLPGSDANHQAQFTVQTITPLI
eukprot:354531_1